MAHVRGVVGNIAVVPSSAVNDIINPVSRTLSSQYTLSHAFSHHALRHPQQTIKLWKKTLDQAEHFVYTIYY